MASSLRRRRCTCRRVDHYDQSLEDVFVNIIDLVKAKRAGNAIHRFDNLKELQDYSHHTRKKFPLDEAKEKKMLEGSLVKMSGPRRL